MASPIGFVGMILPKFKQYSDQWWDQLINQTMVAPIFIFFMYILIKFINVNGIMPKTTGPYDAYFSFFIIIGIIVFAVKTTTKLSGAVGKIAVAAAGMAGGMALGATALAGRAVVGRGAGMIAKSSLGKKLEEKSKNGNWAARVASRGSMAALVKTQGATFDARQTKAGGVVMGQIKAQTGFDVGGHQAQGGFSGAVDRREAKQKKNAKAYERAGFEDEAKRLEKDPGMVANAAKSATNAVFGEKTWENSPMLRNAFIGQAAQERAVNKAEKEKKKRENRQKLGEQIGMLDRAERDLSQGKTPEVVIKITVDAEGKTKHEVIKEETTPVSLIVDQNGKPASSGTPKPPIEKDLNGEKPGEKVTIIRGAYPGFADEIIKTRAAMKEQQHDDRQREPEKKDGGGGESKDKK